MTSYGCSAALLMLVAFCGFPTAVAQSPKCVPNSVAAGYLRSNPGWSLVDVGDLPPDDRKLWKGAHGNSCPGFAVAKLDSSARHWYALALLKTSHGKVYEKAVLLVRTELGVKIRMLAAPQEVTSPFVIWSTGPGTFLNYDTGKEVQLEYDSIVYEKLEAASVQYFLDEGRIRKLTATY